MKRRRRTPRFAGVMAITVACLMPMACGGGGGEWQPPAGGGVSFTPAEPNPGPMTISMGQALVAGNGFQIPIVVTGIDNFFGAAFHVNFDPSSAEFLGYVHEDNADYFIEDPAGTVILLINAVLGAPGVVLVNATREQVAPPGYVSGVTPAAPDNVLILLNFQATAETAGNAFTFSNQEVNACDDVAEECPIVDPGTLTTPWPGGTMVSR